MKKLALVGPPGSGKTSISLAWTGQSGRKISFADKLRFEVASALATGKNFATELLTDMQDPERKGQFRSILQHWGVLRRELEGEDYWVWPVSDMIADLERKDIRRIAVDDCRFPSEYDMLRSKGFIFVRLEPKDEKNRNITAAERLHQSEKYWPAFEADFVLTWEEGPEHQAERIEKWMEDKGVFTSD